MSSVRPGEPRKGVAPDYVITSRSDRLPATRPAGTLLGLDLPPAVDRAAREAIVQSASFVQGLRRAAAPGNLYRIRYLVKRELKQARKARKAEVKQALREYRARHRADIVPDSYGEEIDR